MTSEQAEHRRHTLGLTCPRFDFLRQTVDSSGRAWGYEVDVKHNARGGVDVHDWNIRAWNDTHSFDQLPTHTHTHTCATH